MVETQLTEFSMNDINEEVDESNQSSILSEEKAAKKIIESLQGMSVDEIRKQLKGTKIHAVCCQKGGVGKSTLTSDIAYTLAQKGFSVLAIDLDPQANLSELLNIKTEDTNIKGTANALDIVIKKIEFLKAKGINSYYLEKEEYDKTIAQCIHRTTYRKKVHEGMEWKISNFEFGYDIMPTNINLSRYEGRKLWDLDYGARVLYYMIRNIIKNSDKKYDFILIDELPGLNILCHIGLLAGIDGALVPMNLETLSLMGAQNLIDTIGQIQTAWNRNTTNIKEKHKGILGVIKNRYSGRSLKVQTRFNDVVTKLYPLPFDKEIPESTTCNNAHEVGRLYSEFDVKAGLAYEQLVNEIIARDIYRSTEDYEVSIVKKFGKDVFEEIRKNK